MTCPANSSPLPGLSLPSLARGIQNDHGSRFQSFSVADYDLDSTLTSGQAFRWRRVGQSWHGVIGSRWIKLTATPGGITGEVGEAVADWSWLRHYLQLEVVLADVLETFPKDESLEAAVKACRGLRLLRQEPWECLASFILSSTKQILQIQQIVALLCERYGEPLAVPRGHRLAYAFPSAQRLAELSETDLRACKMGFRAPYLLETARSISSGQFDLAKLHTLNAAEARIQLMALPGVGRKIADCVLLFAYGFQNAFPVDVWVTKALRQLYFPRQVVKPQQLHGFAAEYFGPNAGYAQQYLFHYMRILQPAMPQDQNSRTKPRKSHIRRAI